MMGRGPQAIDFLKKAIVMDFRIPVVFGALATCYSALGKPAEAEQAIASVRSAGDQDLANGLQGELLASSAQLDQSRHFFQLLQSSREPSAQIRGFLSEALVLCELDNFHSAVDVANRRLLSEQDQAAGSSIAQLHSIRAWLACTLGDHAMARRSISQVITLEPGPGTLSMAATTLCRHGLEVPRDIRQGISKFAGLSAEIADLRVAGEVAFTRADKVSALKLFSEASDLEPSFAWREYYARALRGAGRFQEALSLYNKIVATPAVMWLQPLASPPGSWRSAIRQSLQLSRMTGTEASPEVVRAARYLGVEELP
jgi:tetratricopeptide (TPR) repeat protein